MAEQRATHRQEEPPAQRARQRGRVPEHARKRIVAAKITDPRAKREAVEKATTRVDTKDLPPMSRALRR
ncbi:MAG: hypothetical protein M3O86_06100 [Actinomycetota bacterium]|nr:hypothetical protein [Actinomycetota bacterium]